MSRVHLDEVTRMKKSLTKAQTRVQIAKDVIAQLKAKRLKARHSVYVDLVGAPFVYCGDGDAQRLVRSVKACAVCAKGALLVATIDRFNECEATDELALADLARADKERGDPQYMANYFPPSMLHEIEMVFDGGRRDTSTTKKPTAEENVLIRRWRKAHRDATSLLDALMRNIIANKGTFDINKIPKPRKAAR